MVNAHVLLDGLAITAHLNNVRMNASVMVCVSMANANVIKLIPESFVNRD